MTQRHRTTQLTAQLDREWRRLATRRGIGRRLAGVAQRHTSIDDPTVARLSTLDRLDDVVAATDRRHGVTADELLHLLLIVGRTDPLAWRTVLQRILPMTISRAVVHGRPNGHPARAADDAITVSTIVFAAYDAPAARPHVAPRLVDAIVHETFRKPGRRVGVTRETTVDGRLLDRPDTNPDRLDATTAAARLLRAADDAGIDSATIDLGRRLARGESTATIAAARGCHERTIRNHRSKAIATLRSTLGDLDRDWRDPLSLIEHRVAA